MEMNTENSIGKVVGGLMDREQQQREHDKKDVEL
jgi:hypothetical protein